MTSFLKLLFCMSAFCLGMVASFQTYAEDSVMTDPIPDSVPEVAAAKASEAPTFIIETNQGNITVRLYCDVAPKACENFTRLSEKGYYNNVIFHRVIKGFMIQGGDPQGTGRGGESIWGQPFEDEVTPRYGFSKPGILAMANAGPKTNGSQFFITTAAAPWLNNKHTIFGEVVDGYNTVQRIEQTSVDGSSRPATPQQILRIYPAPAAK